MDNGTQTGLASVPGSIPTTPPTFSSPSGAAGGVDEQTKRILAALTQAATQRRAAGTPHPVSLPGLRDPNQPPDYMTSGKNPHAWGAQRLMYGIQSMIGNAVSRQKEQQITKATADWEYAQSALNEYYAAQSSGDPQAMAAAQKKLDVAFGDPKKLKLMAKALNQDWLNPEKTTVHGEALKRVAAQTQQTDQKKQQAKTGIQNMFKSLIDKVKGQQVPYTDEEKQRMEQEVIDKAPTTPGAFDVSKMRDVAELEKAMTEARQKYQYVPAADGSIMAVNKNDPKDAHLLRDTDTGEAVKGKTAAKEGQVYSVNGMPMGVFHAGKPVMPGDPLWKPEDQKMFDAAVTGTKEKQFLRVDPVLAAMVGDPPDPSKFKGGRSDPAYGKELATWGDAVFKKELEKIAASGESRAKAYNQYRPVQVMDADGNVYYTTAQKAIEEGMAGAGEGIKLKPREVQIKDIETASKMMRTAIGNLPEDKFSTAQIAKLKYALTTEDSSLANTELASLASEKLTPEQQDFVIWVRQLNERAMSLRNVAGMGAGAQDLRNAIRAMIPGITSGSKGMMTKQLDAFDNQVKILKGGIAHPGKGKDFGAAPAGRKEGATGTLPDGTKVVVHGGRLMGVGAE